MSVVDLHPEELLDKDERGELTADERARLDAHLDRCAACRAEVVLRADFAAELHGLDGEDRPSALLDLVQGALAAPRPAAAPPAAMPTVAAPTAPGPTAAAPAPAPAPTVIAAQADALAAIGPDAIPGLRRRPRRTAFVLLVAAAVLAASAAGATGLTGRIWLGLRGNPQEVTHASGGAMPKAAPAATNAGASALARPAAPTEAVETPSLPDAIDTPPPAVAEEPAFTAPPPVLALTPARALALTPVRAVAVAPSPIAPSPVAPVAVAPAPSTASALFDSANAARRDGDTATALARYDALDKQFPQTAEARVAKATTGKLLLDRGDAAGALARFDAYLASGANELREEAMAGRATALERLGRSDDEVRAWAALLAAYPGTPYAVHAKTRVGRSLDR